MNKIKQIVKSKFRTGLKTIPYIAIALLVGVTTVYAGNLIPSGDQEGINTMHNLQDIYKLATGGGTSTINPTLTTSPELVGAGHTLNEVYNAVLALTEAPATLTWQPASDPVVELNLCWSYNQYEIENGCTVDSGFIQTPDTLATLGAVEYCKYLNANGTTLANTEQDIWHLPTIQEYISITDYTRYNSATAVTGFAGGKSSYWSGTEDAENPDSAWYWVSNKGNTGSDSKGVQFSVRCAH